MSTKEPLTKEDLREELGKVQKAIDARLDLLRDDICQALRQPFTNSAMGRQYGADDEALLGVDTGLRPLRSMASGGFGRFASPSKSPSALDASKPRREVSSGSMAGKTQPSALDAPLPRAEVSCSGLGGFTKQRSRSSMRGSKRLKPEVQAARKLAQSYRTPLLAVAFKVRMVAIEITTNWWFDIFIGCIIILNSALIGWSANYLASVESDSLPDWAKLADISFAVIFLLEVLLRSAAQLELFWRGPERQWNLFDIIVLVSQLLEIITEGVMAGMSSIVRMLRVLRLTRVVRIVRVIRLIDELRAIISSIVGSIRHVFWTIALLFLLIYTLSVFLLQVATNRKLRLIDEHAPREKAEQLDVVFPNLLSTILVVYQSISGGVDWSQVTALMQECGIHAFIVILYTIYVAFVMFAIMNSVTGVFVEIATKRAKKDQDEFLCTLACKVLEKGGIEQGGEIGWDEFQDCIGCTDMETYLEAIDVKYEDAEMLFNLLDADRSGSITAAEFVQGCIRLSGSSKAVDFAAFRANQNFKLDCLQEQLTELRVCILAGHRLMAQTHLPSVDKKLAVDAAEPAICAHNWEPAPSIEIQPDHQGDAQGVDPDVLLQDDEAPENKERAPSSLTL